MLKNPKKVQFLGSHLLTPRRVKKIFFCSSQGYGLTEVAACTTLNAVDEFVTEEVGPPNQVNPMI